MKEFIDIFQNLPNAALDRIRGFVDEACLNVTDENKEHILDGLQRQIQDEIDALNEEYVRNWNDFDVSKKLSIICDGVYPSKKFIMFICLGCDVDGIFNDNDYNQSLLDDVRRFAKDEVEKITLLDYNDLDCARRDFRKKIFMFVREELANND